MPIDFFPSDRVAYHYTLNIILAYPIHNRSHFDGLACLSVYKLRVGGDTDLPVNGMFVLYKSSINHTSIDHNYDVGLPQCQPGTALSLSSYSI